MPSPCPTRFGRAAPTRRSRPISRAKGLPRGWVALRRCCPIRLATVRASRLSTPFFSAAESAKAARSPSRTWRAGNSGRSRVRIWPRNLALRGKHETESAGRRRAAAFRRRRDLGELIFLNVRDRSGEVQVLFDKGRCPAEAVARAAEARGEDVVEL